MVRLRDESGHAVKHRKTRTNKQKSLRATGISKWKDLAKNKRLRKLNTMLKVLQQHVMKKTITTAAWLDNRTTSDRYIFFPLARQKYIQRKKKKGQISVPREKKKRKLSIYSDHYV